MIKNKAFSIFIASLLLVTLNLTSLFGYFEVKENIVSNSISVCLLNNLEGEISLADSSRAMYVDDFITILGNDSLENVLLSYAQSRNITTLLLYDLHLVHNAYNLTDPATNIILADFISKAKTSYGVTKMGATSENGDYFTNVINVYNVSRSNPDEKFDIYNLEFEFWIDTPVNPGGIYCNSYLIPSGLPCTNAGGFQFFVSALEIMNNLADNSSHPIAVEAYVGWPSASQIDTIGDNLDMLRIHAYVSNGNTAFSYSQERLLNYATSHPNVDVSIIFSAEPVFMQSWLQDTSMNSAESLYKSDWMDGSANWPSNINLGGFTYYSYSDMADIPLEGCQSTIELKDLIFNIDTTIYASNVIDLKNVIINSPNQITLIAPTVHVSTDCEILQGATLTIVEEDGCIDE